MEIGLGVLGLSPRAFWAMSLKELDAALRGRLGMSGAVEPFTSLELSSLMDQFPDLES